ncbi:cupin-like domain-containing protein [Persicitalea jodogahamensis]|uniref:JmjC domain-containing protein n=1 Tax=Persicitalea jodogahamensis TaxID=402147 RepID=A0A8J3D1S1_9BACT|nr:cupin-like domain-containing protein [Persicitalea jodogahamensis]GHB56580.1 hypothetical protein GCM10007390_07420 [Persicitalea jodogahamensis]
MKLTQIERRTGLTREEFIENYLKPRRPVVFTDLIKDWPATQKWTFDWFRKNHGDLEVPLVDNHIHDPDKYFQNAATMPFGEYLSLIEKGPTDLRIFLFDIFKKIPELNADVQFPTIMDGFVKNYKFMFFGGQNSEVNLHYDMDCSNVFLSQFQTRKKIILFPPSESTRLYQHPFTVMSHVHPLHPDLERFPAFDKAQGYETILGHGETVFIPSLWWHYIKYVDGGFGLALRANDSVFTLLKGGMNLARHTVVDKGMNSLLGPKWKEWKENKAIERAQAMMA